MYQQSLTEQIYAFCRAFPVVKESCLRKIFRDWSNYDVDTALTYLKQCHRLHMHPGDILSTTRLLHQTNDPRYFQDILVALDVVSRYTSSQIKDVFLVGAPAVVVFLVNVYVDGQDDVPYAEDMMGEITVFNPVNYQALVDLTCKTRYANVFPPFNNRDEDPFLRIAVVPSERIAKEICFAVAKANCDFDYYVTVSEDGSSTILSVTPDNPELEQREAEMQRMRELASAH